MNESENGPVPGIIGQDVPAEPDDNMLENSEIKTPEEQDKVFDSSDFTGIKDEASKKVEDNKLKPAKEKHGSPLAKWQPWAILSGIFLIGGVAAVLLTVTIMNGKIDDAKAVSKYDIASSETDTLVRKFDDSFAKFVSDTYGNWSNSPTSIYPSGDQINASKKNCLSRYNLNDDDHNYVETRKTGDELLKDGANVIAEQERLSSINDAYKSATDTIETCRDDVTDMIMKDFNVTIGELSYEEIAGTDRVKLSQILKFKYNGKKDISNITITYSLFDANNVKKLDRSVTLKQLESGAEAEADLYHPVGSYYTTNKTDAADKKKMKIKVTKIGGSYTTAKTAS